MVGLELLLRVVVVLGLEVVVLLCRVVVVDLVVVFDCVGRVVRVLVLEVVDCVGRLERTADRVRAVVLKALRLLKLLFLEPLYVLRPFM